MNLSVLIPYREDGGRRDQIFDWILDRYAALLPDAEICIGMDRKNHEFSRSAARNDAYEQANYWYLLVADADTIPEPEAIAHGINMLRDGSPWVIPYSIYYNLGEAKSNEILQSEPESAIVFEADDCEHIINSTAGMLLMERSAWEEVGGYDERFIGWGYEDNAFQLALDTLRGPHDRVSFGRGIHLWHPAPEINRFNQPMIQHNRELYMHYMKQRGKPDRMRACVRR